jgi:hypothetical protein
LFSKSLRGLTVYKMELLGLEGFFMSALLLILPFILLYFIARILPPWPDKEVHLDEDVADAVAPSAPTG